MLIAKAQLGLFLQQRRQSRVQQQLGIGRGFSKFCCRGPQPTFGFTVKFDRRDILLVRTGFRILRPVEEKLFGQSKRNCLSLGAAILDRPSLIIRLRLNSYCFLSKLKLEG